ncbi:TetR/AcrR family transcriptional regulator [Miltoncostaea marina]|uniref:TetR/AcrR family transcriptional regulator n=1 Tax=Miltoncostaea marina TaxID=2843215 RepID=UPI001C3D8DE2|nr:TetR/AcrR family transcriptional regulator [Miltoncostaea marina]
MKATTTPRRGRRAEQTARTRRRIVDAAVELHTTVGPARTTISAIAERAGVQRHTVYAHFPTEEALFGACSASWAERNPFPDPAGWAGIADPRERLAAALGALYAWYDRAGEELARVLADADRVPAMAAQAEEVAGQMGALADDLARGWGLRGRRRARLRAAVGHALALATWRDLVPGGGLRRDEAVALLVAMADAAAAPPTPPRPPSS